MWWLPLLSLGQVCTRPNITEDTMTGLYFCPAGGSSLYRLDDLVAVEANRGCASASDTKGETPCICNYQSHTPRTLVTEILEGVICTDAGSDFTSMTAITSKMSRTDPIKVKGMQCSETTQCVGVTMDQFGSCQPLLPVPAELGIPDLDRLFLYPSDGSRAVQEQGPPCDCHDEPLVFQSFPAGGPTEICHDTTVGWKWQNPPSGIEPTLPIMDPGPEVTVRLVNKTGTPCSLAKGGNRSCGIRYRSPPDSVPVGPTCRNSMPFSARMAPGSMDHELAMGLTFLRTACAADEELDPEFWVNSLVDEFASAPLGNWSGFEQKGYEGNKQQKQWLVLMYAIMLEFGAGDPLKTVGLNPTSGQSVIEQAMLMAGPTLVDLLKEFVDKTYGDPTASDSKLRGFRMTQDEADGRGAGPGLQGGGERPYRVVGVL